jgi:solute carrier family 35 protein
VADETHRRSNYSTLKRGTTIITLFGEWFFLSKQPTFPTLVSTLLLVIGALLAGYGDLGFDLKAYSYAAASCFIQTAYLLLVSKAGVGKNYTTFGILYYNSIYSLAFSTIYAMLFGELEAVMNYPGELTPSFYSCLFLALVQGAMLNYAIFLCTVVNSALTTTIVGLCSSPASSWSSHLTRLHS